MLTAAGACETRRFIRGFGPGQKSSTLFRRIFHVSTGACILLAARACVKVQLEFLSPKFNSKTMPYKDLAGANWRGCDRKRAASETNSD